MDQDFGTEAKEVFKEVKEAVKALLVLIGFGLQAGEPPTPAECEAAASLVPIGSGPALDVEWRRDGIPVGS